MAPDLYRTGLLLISLGKQRPPGVQSEERAGRGEEYRETCGLWLTPTFTVAVKRLSDARSQDIVIPWLGEEFVNGTMIDCFGD